MMEHFVGKLTEFGVEQAWRLHSKKPGRIHIRRISCGNSVQPFGMSLEGRIAVSG